MSAIDTLRRHRFRFVEELQLHEAIAQRWPPTASLEREVRLGERDRIDFLADTLGIEVKVDGSAAVVERQLARYAESDRIAALALVTSCARHGAVAREINGKSTHVIPTFGGFLSAGRCDTRPPSKTYGSLTFRAGDSAHYRAGTCGSSATARHGRVEAALHGFRQENRRISLADRQRSRFKLARTQLM